MVNVKILFMVHSIITLIFGLFFLLVPGLVISYYGGTLNEAGALVGRLFGSALLTFSVVLWFARGSQDSTARQAILKGFFLTLIIGAIVALHGVLTGATNALGWSTVLIYALLALAYGRLVFLQAESTKV